MKVVERLEHYKFNTGPYSREVRLEAELKSALKQLSLARDYLGRSKKSAADARARLAQVREVVSVLNKIQGEHAEIVHSVARKVNDALKGLGE